MYLSLSRLLNTGIQDLPLELLQEIILYSASTTQAGTHTLAKYTLAAARLTCRQFKYAVEPLLFSDIQFDYINSYSDVFWNRMETLAEGTHPFCRNSKTLRIESLVANIDVMGYGKISSSILKAITSLKNVQIVHWNLRTFDSMYFVIDGLATLPRLKELHLNFSEIPIEWQVPDMIPLRNFRNLKSIHITGGNLSDTCAADFLQQIHRLIGSGVALSSLTLTLPVLPPNSPADAEHALREIFKDVSVPTRHSPNGMAHLRHLHLVGYSLRLDKAILPHLRALTSLDISRTHGLETPDAQTHLWTALKESSIHLKILIVEEVVEPLLDYLRSYTGLEDITALGKSKYIRRMDNATEALMIEDARRLSKEFYSVVLPLHCDTLILCKGFNTLTLRAPCYLTQEDMVSLSACTKLRTLAYTFNAPTFLNHAAEEGDFEDVKRTIELALLLPQMTFIKTVNSAKGRLMARCGCFGRRYRASMILNEEKIISGIQINRSSCSRNVADFGELNFNGTPYHPYLAVDGYIRLGSYEQTMINFVPRELL